MTEEIEGLTGAEYAELIGLEWYDEDSEDEDDPAVCPNCGCYGRLYYDDTYVCPNCGDEWAVYPEPPEI